MRSTRLFVFVLCCAGLFYSCKSTTSVDGLRDYMYNPRKGLVQEHSVEGWDFRLAFKPNDLLVAQELQSRGGIDRQVVDSVREKYNKYLYFTLDIGSDQTDALCKVNNMIEYSQRISQLSFNMHQLVKLTTSENDTVYLAGHYLLNTFGLTKKTSMLLVFGKPEKEDTKWIKVTLGEFGLNVGKVHFTFNSKNLKKIPKIERFGK